MPVTAKFCFCASNLDYSPFSSSSHSTAEWSWPAGAGEGKVSVSDPAGKAGRGKRISLSSGLQGEYHKD